MMVPPTANRSAAKAQSKASVRVCDSCEQASSRLQFALMEGDAAFEEVHRLATESNVNLARPLPIVDGRFYPVHCAAHAGSLRTLRWLVEECGVPLDTMRFGGEGGLLSPFGGGGGASSGAARRAEVAGAFQWTRRHQRLLRVGGGGGGGGAVLRLDALLAHLARRERPLTEGGE